MNQAVQILHGPLTDDLTSIKWAPNASGTYLITVGSEGSVFGAGAVSVAQDGVIREDLSALTAGTTKLVYFAANLPVTFSVASANAATSVYIRTTLDPEWPRRY